MKQTLHIKKISDELWQEDVITGDIKDQIQLPVTTREKANKILLDYIHRDGTLETYKKFVAVLTQTRNIVPIHAEAAKRLEGENVDGQVKRRQSPYDSNTSADTLVSMQHMQESPKERTSVNLQSSGSTVESLQGNEELSENLVANEAQGLQDDLSAVTPEPPTSSVGDGMIEDQICSFVLSPSFADYVHSSCDLSRLVISLLNNNTISKSDVEYMGINTTSKTKVNASLILLFYKNASKETLMLLSKALKNDRTHAGHQELTKRIDRFLLGLNKIATCVSRDFSNKSTGYVLQHAQLPPSTCPTASFNLPNCLPQPVQLPPSTCPTASLNLPNCLPQPAQLPPSTCQTASLNLPNCLPQPAQLPPSTCPTASLNRPNCLPQPAQLPPSTGPTASFNLPNCLPQPAQLPPSTGPTASLNLPNCLPQPAQLPPSTGPTA